MTRFRTALVGLTLAAALGVVAAPGTAHADRDGWRGHGPRGHGGWRGPVYYAPPPVYYAPPRAYYAPPPVYYAPAPVYYAPRPYYAPAPGVSLGIGLNFR